MKKYSSYTVVSWSEEFHNVHNIKYVFRIKEEIYKETNRSEERNSFCPYMNAHKLPPYFLISSLDIVQAARFWCGARWRVLNESFLIKLSMAMAHSLTLRLFFIKNHKFNSYFWLREQPNKS